MNELLVFLQSLPEAFKTGFIYSIMVMGVYLTYKILDFPDMSVDGTFPLGGFVFAAFALSCSCLWNDCRICNWGIACLFEN